jgi:uncharacterized membrane protein YdjX (TVP38/TMEM64 family)
VTERPFLHRPSLEDFVYEGEEVPLLLRKKVIAGIVLAFLLLVIGYVVASRIFGISYSIDAEPLRNWIDKQGVWAPLVFIAIMALSVLFAPIPNIPIFIAAGLIWGPVVGTIYSMAGMMLGSVMAFYAARWLGRKHLGRLIGRKAAQRLDSLVDRMGGRLVLAARLLPVVNFDWISMVAGLTAMRFWTFFVYSFIGMLIPTTVAVVAGDSLENNIGISIALAGVWVAGIVASAMFFWHRRKRWRESRDTPGLGTGSTATRAAVTARTRRMD